MVKWHQRLVLGRGALVLLCFAGVLFVPILGFKNGLLAMIQEVVAAPQPVLPGTNIPLRTSWTGLQLVDFDFSLMVVIFSTILDESNLSIFIAGGHFFGLWMSSWILILLESHRIGPEQRNTYTLRNYSYVLWGLLMEFASVAIGLPIWCALSLFHISFAASAQLQTSASPNNTKVPLEDLELLPWSFAAATGIPTLLMLVCSPKPESLLWSRQTWILIRLFHPLLTALVQGMLRRTSLPPILLPRSHVNENDDELRLRRMNHLYFVAFWIAAGPHILTLSAIFLAYAHPLLLSAHVVTSLSLAAVWPLSFVWQGFVSKITTFDLGISAFLTANEAVSSMAILIWAWNMNKARVHSIEHLRLGPWKVAIMTLVFGPGAAAVTLIQNRDQVSYEVSIQEKHKAS